MKNRKHFRFYRSYFEVAQKMKPKDAGEFLMAVLKKQFLDEEPNLKGMAEFAYISQKHNIDQQVKGYKDKVATSRPNEDPFAPPTQGGRQGGAKGPSEQHTTYNIQHTTNNKEGINKREGEQVAAPPPGQTNLDLKQPDEAKEKKPAPKKRKVFQPPTEAEVEAYCKEKGYRVSAVRFVSFYQSKNWHVGKNKMSDWKSACRNWDLRDRQDAKSKDVAPIGHHIEGRRNYSLEDFYGTSKKN